MARGNFGERLKREREMREVSLKKSPRPRESVRAISKRWKTKSGATSGAFSIAVCARHCPYLGLDEENLLSSMTWRTASKTISSGPTKTRSRAPRFGCRFSPSLGCSPYLGRSSRAVSMAGDVMPRIVRQNDPQLCYCCLRKLPWETQCRRLPRLRSRLLIPQIVPPPFPWTFPFPRPRLRACASSPTVHSCSTPSCPRRNPALFRQQAV